MKEYQEGAASAVVINKDNEILFLKRSEEDSFHPGEWDLPGGNLNTGESPEEGVVREVLEETGLSVVVIKILNINSRLNKDSVRLYASYLCKIVGELDIQLSSEHTEYMWLRLEDRDQLNLDKYIDDIATSAEKDIV